MGALCIERVQYPQAEQYLKRALKIREEKYGPHHSRVTQTLKHLVTLFELQEKFTESLKCATKVLTNTGKQSGTDSSAYATVLVRVGTLHFLADGRSSFEGKRMLQRAIEIYSKRHGPESKEVKDAQAVLKDFAEQVVGKSFFFFFQSGFLKKGNLLLNSGASPTESVGIQGRSPTDQRRV